MADLTKADEADWYASMLDQQTIVTKRAIDECNRLRRRVRELEQELTSGTAATLSELQDRVTQLELLLEEARDAQQ